MFYIPVLFPQANQPEGSPADETHFGITGDFTTDSTPASLPGIYVYDFSRGTGVPTAFLRDYDNKLSQSVCIQKIPMEFKPGGTDLTTGDEGIVAWCIRASEILLVVSFGEYDGTSIDTTVNRATIRIVYLDRSDIIYPGESVVVTPLQYPVNGLIMSEILRFPTLGAKGAYFYIEDSSVPISLKIAVV